MKTYQGMPDANDICWAVSTVNHRFRWDAVGRTALARALLIDVLADDARTLKLYQRFKLRTVSTWEAGKPFTITEDEILAIVADIESIERDPGIAAERRKVQHERAPVNTEYGPGVLWDTDEQGNRVRPRGADE